MSYNLNTFCMDHINDNDTMQDVYAVMSILEAARFRCLSVSTTTSPRELIFHVNDDRVVDCEGHHTGGDYVPDEEYCDLLDIDLYISMMCVEDGSLGSSSDSLVMDMEHMSERIEDYTGVTVVHVGIEEEDIGMCVCKDEETTRTIRDDGDDNDDVVLVQPVVNTSRDDRFTAVSYRCETGHRDYLDEASFSSHVMSCNAGSTGKVSMVQAWECAESMMSSKGIRMPLKGRNNPDLSDLIVTEDIRTKNSVPMLWARRETQGQTLGRNTVSRYMTDIM